MAKSKSEQLLQARLKRVEEGKFGCDLEGLYEYLDAFAEEVLEEIKPKNEIEREQAKTS